MTVKEKGERLFQTFISAWENYAKLEKEYASSKGAPELLTDPALKKAYQAWQFAVRDYYDFAKSVEKKQFTEQVA